jgi:hypothetical protein
MSTFPTLQNAHTINCSDMNEAAEELQILIRGMPHFGRVIGVITPTQHETNALYALLRTSPVTPLFLSKAHKEPGRPGSIMIVALEKTKGMEFDEVVLFLNNEQFSSLANSDDFQFRKVAVMTRARAALTVICH